MRNSHARGPVLQEPRVRATHYRGHGDMATFAVAIRHCFDADDHGPHRPRGHPPCRVDPCDRFGRTAVKPDSRTSKYMLVTSI